MKKLRARARSLTKRIKRRQDVRGRLVKTEKWMRGHKFRAIANAIDKRAKQVHREIKQAHKDLHEVEKKIDKLVAARDNDREDFVAAVKAAVGVVEGSGTQRHYAADLGYSWTLPWCSIFVGYFLKHKGGFSGRLPANPAYSGAWLAWSHGYRVSYSQAQAGDLLVYDWGDGGMTDHVAVYVGGGRAVGGNQSNAVTNVPVPSGSVVGVIRPRWDD